VTGRRLTLCLALAFATLLAPMVGAPQSPGAEPAAAGLDPAARRGKRSYLEGVGAGEIVALVGDQGFEVPASSLPCGSCHGADGRGRPEGGVSPTDLTWEALTRPYGVTHPSGRHHPPYTEELLARAVTDGLDPAGTALNTAMPRYRMTPADLADLVAYLRRLGADRDPGVADDRLVLGALLPPAGERPAVAAAIREALGTVTRRVNDRGGVYGRRLELAFFELPADPAARTEAVAGFLDRRGVFALAPSYLGGSRELVALAGERGLPVVAPVGIEPRESFPLDRTVFYLVSGVAGPARAAAVAAAERAAHDPESDGRWAVVHADAGELAEAAEAAMEVAGSGAGRDDARSAVATDRAREGEATGRPKPAAVETLTYPAGRLDAGRAALGLRDRGVSRVVFLGSAADAAALVRAGSALGWRPEMLLPGELAGPELFELPPADLGRVTVALAAPPSAGGVKGPAVTVLAGAELLVEGLELAGRRLSRESFVAALEGLYDHATGLVPRLTYGPNRRIGARGAWLGRLDPAGGLVEAEGWIPLDH
jgi:ABC-type branched-subunit amino acid transport system substrate-binding protein